MKSNPVSLLITLLLFSSCKSAQWKQTANNEPYPQIAQSGITDAELDKALKKLEMPPLEPARYWIMIANNPRNSDYHRRRAIFEFFKRHVREGVRLTILIKQLDHPAWIHAWDIDIIEKLGGHIPVQFHEEDTVVVLRIFAEQQQNTSAIYLRIGGKHGVESLRRLFLGEDRNSLSEAIIKEIGYSEQ